MLRQIKSLVVTLLLIILGFAGGTVIYEHLADDAQIEERPWFVEQAEEQSAQMISLETEETRLDTSVEQVSSALLTEPERIMASVYNSVSPSVVAINVFRETSGFGFEGELATSGSGFVIDSNGHIVTNYHVVEGADEIVVNFVDGTIVRAEPVGLDIDSDLAVIKVDLPEGRLFPVKFGSEDDLIIGQAVVAIGSPFQQRWTMTSGIVSALERDIQGLGTYRVGSVIQTDAPINPGNSGGPLLNLLGEVVGVNSQIISQTRSSSGVGFAVPSTLVQRVAKELIERGSVEYSFIGIGTLDAGGEITIDVIELYDLANNQRGLPIGTVQLGSPADEAGLRPATEDSIDIITAVDGIPVNGFAELIGYLAEKTRPGDEITLSVLRGSELIEVPLTLANR
jgi:2-alkenal reductase